MLLVVEQKTNARDYPSNDAAHDPASRTSARSHPLVNPSNRFSGLVLLGGEGLDL
jgi:hypothetical protein